MKLRRIRLNNLRRFTTPVQIDGIADGLNVLSAPNERGKSTLFDAVQAVFFEKHRSRKQAILALQPHAGGAPEVAVEVETPDGTFVIEKRWLSRPQARITQGARLIAQADDAEAWIARLIGGDGGPTGLLWVRQGLTSLDQRDEGALEARRDLLSSVAGEVEAMTGGRRMDAALRRCREELGSYLTATGRARADGPLAVAQRDVATLEARRETLAGQVADLAQALARRREIRRQLAELHEPEAVAGRQQRLTDAAAALTRAERHAETLEKATEAVAIARLKADGAAQALAALRAARREVDEATRAVTETGAARREADEAAAEAQGALTAAAGTAEAAAQAAGAALRVLTAALRRDAAGDNQRRRADLVQRIAQAETARRALEEATARAATGPTPAQIARLDELAQAVVTAQRLRAARAVRITMTHVPGGGGGVLLDGMPLDDGRAVAITAPTTLALRGLGQLSIDPGAIADSGEGLAAAEAAVQAALDRLGQPDHETARRAAVGRQAAEAAANEARAQLRILAPDGIEALQGILATLPADPDPDDGLPTSAAAQAAHDKAEADLRAAEAARVAAQAQMDARRDRAARAAAAEDGARARQARAASALTDADPATREAELAADLAQQTAAHAEAEARRSALERDAPDLAVARAARDRAQSVVDTARAEAEALTRELGGLDTLIELRASEAVEEELADTEARLGAARAQFDRIAFEVATLKRLETALHEARTRARERYFEPVMAELAPLVRLLWPEADLSFDDATLLPSALIREGQEEGLDILSGGTQEQVALLVRLAFARMHARAGRAAPLILDDALVFTDDDRIEAMFDALHRQAADLQIIVLTCRQRAFRDLGGNRLTLSAAPEGA